MNDFRLNPKLRDVWFTPARMKIVHGGRSSSKSQDFAGAIAYMGSQVKLKVAVCRQFQSSIKDSCKSLIESKIELLGLSHRYDFQRSRTLDLETGTEYIYLGVARNITELKSIDNIDILILEEGAKLTKEQFLILEPCIRKEGSEIWIIFNPDLATDFVWSLVLNPPADTIVKQINYPDNPWNSKTMQAAIADAKRRLPKEDFDHIYLGVPRTDDQLSFIKDSWLRACIDSHIRLNRPGILNVNNGKKRTGLDLADEGSDTSAVACSVGNYLYYIEEWKSDEGKLLESVQKGYNVALENNSILIPDVIGIGASAIPRIVEMNTERLKLGLSEIEYDKFHAGESASETEYQPETLAKDHFTNKKGEAWGIVSDRARNTFVLLTAIEKFEQGLIEESEIPNFEDYELMSISSEIPSIEKLIKELSSPRKIIDLSGRTMCEKKADLKKRGIPSPNLADAAIISLYTPKDNIGIMDEEFW